MDKLYIVISRIPYEGSHLLQICDNLDSVKTYLHEMVDDYEWYRDKLFVIDANANINKDLDDMEFQSIEKFL